MRRFWFGLWLLVRGGAPVFCLGMIVGMLSSVPVIRESFDQVDLRLDRASICGTERKAP